MTEKIRKVLAFPSPVPAKADYQRVKSIYSIREIKQMFGLSERTIRRWTETGIIQAAPVSNEEEAHYDFQALTLFREAGYEVRNAKLVDSKTGEPFTFEFLVDDSATQRFVLFYKPSLERLGMNVNVRVVDAAQYENLRDAMEKLRLNDSAFTYEPETSLALGFGFRCGYLGLLHMEIVQERLEREFDLSLITTAPSVPYRITTTRGEVLEISNPVKLPETQLIDLIEEPRILATIITKDEYLGGILALCEERRGRQVSLEYAGTQRAVLKYDLPLNEVILDFYDKLKSLSRGYASFDYQLIDYRPGDLVKLDILINGEPVDALAFIVHRSKAQAKGRALVEKMKEMIPQQMFEVVIQAAIGSKILARSTVKAMRKNVLAKCYGGDITRKKKLLEKQKEGKRRMKKVGRVELPQEAFLAVLKVE